MKIDGYSRAREIQELKERREQRAPSTQPPSIAPASETRISTPGRLFSQLAELSHEDPAAFKQVAQKIADELRDTIGEGSERGDRFAERLAERFEQAATSGDLGSFAPPRGDESRGNHDHDHHHHHHHGHHHRGLRGFGDDVKSVLENALDLVHEARTRASEAPPAAAEPTEPGAETNGT